MVHALRESLRVLRSTGILIDLRPFSIVFPIDVIAGSSAFRVGQGDAAATIDDERAAERAVAAEVERGSLMPRYQTRFELYFYWNTVAAMADYMRTGRTVKRVTPSYSEIDAMLGAAADRTGAPARLRATRPMTLASYTKGPGS
jgi:hypothetical protein